MENNPLFRQKSIDRVSSPENLQEYMRVTNPGIWMLLAAVIVLLAGFIALCAVGRLETTLDVYADVEGGAVTIALNEKEGLSVDSGMPLRIGSAETVLDYVREDDDGSFTAYATLDLPDGSYEAKVVTDSVSPISFLLN